MSIWSVLAAFLHVFYISQGMLVMPSGMDRLYKDLMATYNPIVRPVRNPQDRVTISFSSSLIQIVDVDEKSQLLTTQLWLELEWTDNNLQWDPIAYENITEISIPQSKLWTPDIVLYNDAGGSPQIKTQNSAKIDYTGKLQWKPPAIFTSFCELNMLMFPYDDQHCELKFDIQFSKDSSSCESSKNTVVSRLEPGMSLAYYIPNVEWSILNISAVRHERIYPGCCGDIPYLDITYYLHIRRLKLFHTVNLLMPCVLVSILIVGVFYMPCESQEKLTLSMSILVTLVVFLLFITDIVPPTSTSVSLIERFILVDMILVSSCIGVTIITEYLKFAMSDRKMPNWVKIFFLKFWGPLLRVTHNSPRRKHILPVDQTTPLLAHSESLQAKIRVGYFKRWGPDAYLIQRTLDNIAQITEYYKDKQEEENLCYEWNKVAMVFDRMCFWLFGLASLGAIGIFLSPLVFAKDSRLPLMLSTPNKPLV